MSQLPPKVRLPLLPLRDIVVFPHMMVPLYVGRSKSIRAVEEAMQGSREIVLAAQKKAKTNDPDEKDIFEYATVGQVMQHIKRPDGTIKVLVEGRRRTRIERFVETQQYFCVEVEDVIEIAEGTSEQRALQRTVHEIFDTYARLSKRLQADVLQGIRNIEDPSRLADTILAHLAIKHQEKQGMLEMLDPYVRLEKLYELMQAEIEILQVERKIRTRVKKQMERTEKEYYLNEQMRAIQKELGERDEFKGEILELEERLKTKQMNAEARTKVEKEIKKIKMMSPMSAEATVVRNYIDWCLALPWNTYSSKKIKMEESEAILDADHFGLEKVKERILEYLAVHSLVKVMRGPILCLVGPPGVGKTSLARSIAKATGRNFLRISLGGVRDEAEIRGHRRTYIGALPGKVIQGLKRAGNSDPLILLDEIDKMSHDVRGDPSSALLEVLDPEQNATFNDHYLDLDYDLSRCMFVCTANSTETIPAALEDRLEIIRIAGYTEHEKLSIAQKYLVPKECKENGLEKVSIDWPEAAVRTIIQSYTREAGVRTLQREIASVCRKMAKEVVKKGTSIKFKLNPARVKKYLGVEKFQHSPRHKVGQVGMSTGLAWTSVGGAVLEVEVSLMPGKSNLTITGKLGEVMQESAKAAVSYVRNRAAAWGLPPDFYASLDIHLHVPEGATPKDGPSAGITIATALVSALTKMPVRHDVAMTGEITVLGRVLPIGGLKEKILAAHQRQIYTVIIPEENAKDLADIPKPILRAMKIIPVSHIDQVLRHAIEQDTPDTLFNDISPAAALAGSPRLPESPPSPETH
jgi:ATP-dependent Lon protease